MNFLYIAPLSSSPFLAKISSTRSKAGDFITAASACPIPPPPSLPLPRNERRAAPIPVHLLPFLMPQRWRSDELTCAGVSASALMELQEAAARLQSRCAQLEAANAQLRASHLERDAEVVRLRAVELLLRKESALWSSYCRLFAEPLHETRVALARYAAERCAELLRGEAAGLRQEREELRQCVRRLEARSVAHSDAAHTRMEGKEKGSSGNNNNNKTNGNSGVEWMADELRARDAYIAQLQRTVRELHACVAAAHQRMRENTILGSEGSQSPDLREFLAEELNDPMP